MMSPYRRSPHLPVLALAVAGALAVPACSPESPSDPGQTTGQIRVDVSTDGTGQPTSFSVRLDGGASQSVEPDGSVTFGSLAPGNYEVELVVPGNCTISDSATRSVGVQEGSTSSASFTVTCSAVPTGAIGVTTSTTGSPADPDGYAIVVDGGAEQPIGVNGNELLPDLTVGDHEIELTGEADNCAVQGENPRPVEVSENQTTQVEFEVVCSATTGAVEVTVETTGAAPDDDYAVLVDDEPGGSVGANDLERITGVEQGTRALSLELPDNCTVTSEHPLEVEVVAGETVEAAFTVDCASTTGSLTVTVNTTGDEPDPNGYAIQVDGGSDRSVEVDDETTFESLTPGNHEVELTDNAANCGVAGENPRTVSVEAGETTETAFDVTCSSTTGAIEVTAPTTGDALDDEYIVLLDGDPEAQLEAPDYTTVLTGLDPGEHDLDLADVAANCTVTSPRPVTAEVTAGETDEVSFAVECEELTGTLVVSTTTTGDSPDPDGYAVTLDGGDERDIGTTDTETYNDVVIGEHEVELTGVADNCGVQDANPRTATVTEGATETVEFDITCSATTGAIEVTVSTTGDDLDPDNYTVDLDGDRSQPINVNGSTTFTGVEEGVHTLTLQNVAGNCDVDDNPQNTSVTAGETSDVDFSVTCTRTTGDILVTTGTSGVDQDDGYTVSVNGDERPIDADDTELFEDLEPDDYTVTLSDIADNCTVGGEGPSRDDVPVDADEVTQVVFDVDCEALVGDLRVEVSTTGDDAPAGYTVRRDEDADTDRSIGADGSTTYEDIAEGSHEVELRDVPGNCEVDGTNPRTVDVVFVLGGDVTFDVTCEATTGTIGVSVSTSGDDPDPDGYTITVTGESSETVDPDDSTTYPDLAPDDYDVGIDPASVADNCAVNETNPQEVTLAAGETENVSFTVTCTEITGTVEVTTETTGDPADLDPDDYEVVIDGGTPQPIGLNATEAFGDVPDGVRSVLLDDVADNCDVTGSNPRDVNVPADDTETTTFEVTCNPTTGAILATVETTVGTPDPDGYLVSLDEDPEEFIDDDTEVVYDELVEDTYEVELSGLDGTCTTSSTNPATSTVVPGDTVGADFEVECP